MASAAKNEQSIDDLGRAFERIDGHNGRIARVEENLGSLTNTVDRIAGKMDALFKTVTEQVAGRGPSLSEILSGALTLALFVGAMATGVGVYVSSTYSGTISQLQSDAAAAKAALALRDSEDRAELAELRRQSHMALGERLKALEEREKPGGWTARATPIPQ